MSICDDALQKGLDMLDAAMDPLINQAAGMVKDMTEKGADPRRWYDPKNKKLVDMVQFLADLAEKKNAEVAGLRAKVEKDCRQTTDFVQEVIDAVIASYTLGLSEVLPKHITHIDVGQILSGKPLGGDNSIFNVIRDQVFFESMGIDADSPLGRAVSNPFSGSNFKDGVNQLFEQWGLPVRL